MEASADRLGLPAEAKNRSLDRFDRIASAARKGYGFRDVWDTLGHRFQHINLRRAPNGELDTS